METMKRKQINKVISYSDNEWEENETGVLIVHGGWASLRWSGKALLKEIISYLKSSWGTVQLREI